MKKRPSHLKITDENEMVWILLPGEHLYEKLWDKPIESDELSARRSEIFSGRMELAKDMQTLTGIVEACYKADNSSPADEKKLLHAARTVATARVGEA